MPCTLLFVHGTGVRNDQTQNRIRESLGRIGREDVEVTGVAWGDRLGVKLGAPELGQLLPTSAAKSLGVPLDDEEAAALWSLLLDDPLFEIRVVAVQPPSANAAGVASALPGADPPAVVLADRLRRLTLGEPPPGGVNEQVLRRAADTIAMAGVLTEAATVVGDAEDADFVAAVARAVVAEALRADRDTLTEGPDALYAAPAREALVTAVAGAITPATKGIGGWLKDKVRDFALAKATAAGRDRRVGLMQAATPGVGDILLYQRRGQAISELVLGAVEAAPHDKPLVLVGHSLGGVILFDLLASGRVQRPVHALVTAGSQAPFFYKCDASETLRLGDSGRPFTPWLNLYDRNDMLSFLAVSSFASTPGIRDVEVRSGAPFPASHGAYWRLPEVYQEIAAVCP